MPGKGIDGVSTLYAENIWKDLCFHDDGVVGHGGTNCLTFGSQGSGKTTIALHIVPKVHFIPDVKKTTYLAGKGGAAHSETIIWAGNEQDYWNAFIPDRFSRCFPGIQKKPLRVFSQKDDKYTFYERGKTDQLHDVTNRLDIYKYRDKDDLMNHLIPGGVNVVYTPYTNYLSTHLKHLLNERMMVSSEDPKFLPDEKDILVPSFIFWYELFENIYSIRGEMRGRQWYSFILDECHRIFPLNPRAPLWHLVDWFADVLVDTRRANLSIYGFTHGSNIIDFRVLARFGHWIWLVGSKPSPEYSRVSPHIVSALSKLNEKDKSKNQRWAIAERARQYFGKFPFPDIPNRPDLLIARREPAPVEKPPPPIGAGLVEPPVKGPA